MTKTLRLLAIALLALIALPIATASADVPEGAEWTETWIKTPGQPDIHVDVFRKKGLAETAKTPVILAIGPYFGHGGQSTPDADPTGIGTDPPGTNRPSNRFDDMIEGAKVFDRGYTVVYADLRGFGGSHGCNDFGGNGEQIDTKRAVEWAASQPWSTGKVGMWGKSYDAWTQVMALDEKPKGLAATVIQAPIIDGYRTLYQNGVHYDAGWYATPGLYQQIDAIPPAPADSAEYKQAWVEGFNPPCYGQNIFSQNTTFDWSNPFWQERNLPGARGSDVPTLWAHGFMDANTKPDNFMDVWSKLTGPKHAWFGQWDHVRGNEDHLVGRKGFLDESMRWFDRYVKGDASVDPDVDPAVTVQEADGKFRPENAWPPTDAQPHTMPLRPGTVRDLPNNDAEGETSGEYGNGIYSVSQPFPHDARIAGMPRVKLDVTAPGGRNHLVALLYDVDGRGYGQLVSRAAHMVSGNQTIDFELYPQDWTIRQGHRLLLLTAGSDLDWYNPPHSGQTITVKGGTLTTPFLRYERVGFLEGGPAKAMEGRKSLRFNVGDLEDGAVTAQMPPKAEPFPEGMAPRGGNQITLAQAMAMIRSSVTGSQADRRTTVTLRRVTVRGRKQLAAFVTNARTKKLRIVLRHNGRTISRRVRTVKRGNAATAWRQRGFGRFQVRAYTIGKKPRLLASSRVFKARPTTKRR